MKTGLEAYYTVKNNKKLRFGYTTGSCSAAAAKAAAIMLLSGKMVDQVELLTPKGILLHLEVVEAVLKEDRASCAIRKDGGDDPDATHGTLIYAQVTLTDTEGIVLDGGVGVGRVTRPGLAIPVGEAAINPVPREMIRLAVVTVMEEYNYGGGMKVVISVPEGEQIASKTFNPRLGIVGGISILGTSGIVEPMSEAALIRSIEMEMDMRLAQGRRYLLVTPGNYGADYLKQYMELPWEENIKCSNYVGETLDMAVNKDVKGLLFVSHIGKFVKVAAGIMNTHSHQADGRVEVLASAAVRAGCQIETARAILDSGTTEEALHVIDEARLLEETMQVVLAKIQYYLDFHTYGGILTGAVIFSGDFGYLGQTANAGKLMQKINGIKD